MSDKIKVIGRICGIYLLWRGNEVVYVGQSNSVVTRVYFHLGEGNKEFDSFSYIECSTDEMDRVEMEMILKYKPVYNSIIPTGGTFLNTSQIKSLLPDSLGIRNDARLIRRWLLSSGLMPIQFLSADWWPTEAVKELFAKAQDSQI